MEEGWYILQRCCLLSQEEFRERIRAFHSTGADCKDVSAGMTERDVMHSVTLGSNA